ncbi:UNVERIFIED_CONTAM: hypothetical protein Sangu_2081800 [Sesamum angustifolium]|uniref:Late embryogenesis abundant protein LEA-2 subgroup domain-containing protein n=1 Tax=Sesamum angustifolium TaxID=2727405 RepID=A0AAW2LNF6_9LAMI
MALCGFIVLFTVFCLIIWGAGRPFKAEVAVRSLTVNNLYLGSGADFTGVPTKMLNVNGSLRISVYNPATFYGIHVSATPVNLVYSDVVVATGQVSARAFIFLLRVSKFCIINQDRNNMINCCLKHHERCNHNASALLCLVSVGF